MDPRSTPIHAAFGRVARTRRVPLDAALHWGCSGKGWNCCVGKGITVRPYDLIRLRHALRLPAQEIINRELVTFGWYPGDGSLAGSLAHRPYGDHQVACVFLHEITDAVARDLSDQDPAAFRALPPSVQRAAAMPAREPWRVAGLCQVHGHRPEVCRAFPFQRDPQTEGADSGGAAETHRCGSCALSTPTTVRAVMEGEGLTAYWRATEAFNAVAAYLRALGLARLSGSSYRPLPVDEPTRAELWMSLYVADADEAVRARFGDQWDREHDAEGDDAILRLLLERALTRAEALVTGLGSAPARLGFAEEMVTRPDLNVLLDPARPMLPPPSATTAPEAASA